MAQQNLDKRIRALPADHYAATKRFQRRLEQFEKFRLLSKAQSELVLNHVVRLGERGRNPANTGNIEDLFCHTLQDTRDPIRAFSQALADSIKVVPMLPETKLWPPVRTLDGHRHYTHVADFSDRSPEDVMLICHTMAAYGDTETWTSALDFVVASTGADKKRAQREVSRMAVQSQHLPSSSFVMARAHQLTIDVEALYRDAGYTQDIITNAQHFYDIAAEFLPEWADEFTEGHAPNSKAWQTWHARYLHARDQLPTELIYQLCSDTLTNFMPGTLEAGKWTDAAMTFHQVESADALPAALAKIVNQYLCEQVALHNRSSDEFIQHAEPSLHPWGVQFENGRATVTRGRPERAETLLAQFQHATARRNRPG